MFYCKTFLASFFVSFLRPSNGKRRRVSWMAGAPIAIGGEACFEVLRDKLVVVVDKTGFDLRCDGVPAAIDIGGESGFWHSRATKIAFTDEARQKPAMAASRSKCGLLRKGRYNPAPDPIETSGGHAGARHLMAPSAFPAIAARSK